MPEALQISDATAEESLGRRLSKNALEALQVTPCLVKHIAYTVAIVMATFTTHLRIWLSSASSAYMQMLLSVGQRMACCYHACL